jgi:pimeloyl-ACP methyl ester carboxylesterase
VRDWRLGKHLKTEQGTVAWDQSGDGPPIVLVHGTPWSSFVWRHIAVALSPSWTVYVFDLPGFGSSEKRKKQDVSLAAQGRVLGEVLDAWGVIEPIVVAHDIGGAIALRAALLHARRFAALALLDPVAISPWGSPFYRLVRDHSDVFEALPPHIHAAVANAYISSALPVPIASDVFDALLDPWLAPGGQAALYRQIAQGDERHTDEFRPHLAKLACPTLILWGEEDPWIPPERGRELERLIPHATLRTIKGAGHLIQEDAPGEVLHHLNPFLAAVQTPLLQRP